MSLTLHPSSRISFHHLKLSTQPDGQGLWVIVRWDTDESLQVEPDVVEIIQLLSRGKTLGEAANAVKRTSEDVIGLLKQLGESGFIGAIDGIKLPDTAPKIRPWFPALQQKWFGWVLAKPVLLMGFIIILSGVAIGLFTPHYFPSYTQFFWSSDLLLVLFSLLVIDIILLVIHESAHFTATKAVGGEAVMRFSNRFIYVVAETESYHLAVVPKSLRYFVYLAGMYVDFLIIACIYWVFFLSDWYRIPLGLARNFLLIVVLLEIKGIVWQYSAFLKTDTYNFLADFFGQENLEIDAKKILMIKIKRWKSKIGQIVGKGFRRLFFKQGEWAQADDMRTFTRKERRVLFIYSLVLVSGLLFVTLEYIYFILPKDGIFIFYGFKNLFRAISTSNVLDIAKSLLLIILVAQQYIMLSIIWFHNRMHKES